VTATTGDEDEGLIAKGIARGPSCYWPRRRGASEGAAVRDGRSVEDLIPVGAYATKENAERLPSRLDFIQEEFLRN
jgi:hypothetical protein